MFKIMQDALNLLILKIIWILDTLDFLQIHLKDVNKQKSKFKLNFLQFKGSVAASVSKDQSPLQFTQFIMAIILFLRKCSIVHSIL